MARSFNGTSSDSLVSTTLAHSSLPLAMSCWFKADNITAFHPLVWLSSSVNNARFVGLSAGGSVGGDPLQMYYGNTTVTYAATSSGFTADTWHHACGIVYDLGGSIRYMRAFLDGGSKGTANAAVSDPVLDRTCLGCLIRPSSNYLTGDVAEAAIYDLSGFPGATDANKADYFETHFLPGLAAGATPRMLPFGLANYWPIGGMASGNASPEVDLDGGIPLTVTGTSVVDHPGGLIYPSSIQLFGLSGDVDVSSQSSASSGSSQSSSSDSSSSPSSVSSQSSSSSSSVSSASSQSSSSSSSLSSSSVSSASSQSSSSSSSVSSLSSSSSSSVSSLSSSSLSSQSSSSSSSVSSQSSSSSSSASSSSSLSSSSSSSSLIGHLGFSAHQVPLSSYPINALVIRRS